MKLTRLFWQNVLLHLSLPYINTKALFSIILGDIFQWQQLTCEKTTATETSINNRPVVLTKII